MLSLLFYLSCVGTEKIPNTDAVSRWAIKEQLMDIRERTWFFYDNDINNYQIHLLLKRWWDLKNVPKIEEIYNRLPPLENIQEVLKIQHRWLSNYENKLALYTIYYPQHESYRILKDCLKTYNDLYILLEKIKSRNLYIAERRQAIAEYRAAVGPAAYYNGWLPPIVPESP